uniref:Fe2OG dioxygenase domain-containing protein n=1 Tax=Eutreptiella gymnastica TaxID=73025 RepID=A0A7S1IZX1_9EUGL|mmetsp:Transcript_56172/g.99979  ORF Transcript_56172/g.99979 Transcript_56172/m.99979 type:complete len:830 (+) Transcript_56172:92-2581(+)
MNQHDEVRFCKHRSSLRCHYEEGGPRSRVWLETRDCTVSVVGVRDMRDLRVLMEEQIGQVRWCIVLPETNKGFVEFDTVKAAKEALMLSGETFLLENGDDATIQVNPQAFPITQCMHCLNEAKIEMRNREMTLRSKLMSSKHGSNVLGNRDSESERHRGGYHDHRSSQAQSNRNGDPPRYRDRADDEERGHMRGGLPRWDDSDNDDHGRDFHGGRRVLRSNHDDWDEPRRRRLHDEHDDRHHGQKCNRRYSHDEWDDRGQHRGHDGHGDRVHQRRHDPDYSDSRRDDYRQGRPHGKRERQQNWDDEYSDDEWDDPRHHRGHDKHVNRGSREDHSYHQNRHDKRRGSDGHDGEWDGRDRHDCHHSDDELIQRRVDYERRVDRQDGDDRRGLASQDGTGAATLPTRGRRVVLERAGSIVLDDMQDTAKRRPLPHPATQTMRVVRTTKAYDDNTGGSDLGYRGNAQSDRSRHGGNERNIRMGQPTWDNSDDDERETEPFGGSRMYQSQKAQRDPPRHVVARPQESRKNHIERPQENLPMQVKTRAPPAGRQPLPYPSSQLKTATAETWEQDQVAWHEKTKSDEDVNDKADDEYVRPAKAMAAPDYRPGGRIYDNYNPRDDYAKNNWKVYEYEDCKHLLPSGLTYIPEFIKMDDERRLLDWLNDRNWAGDLERRTQQFGYKFEYHHGQALTRIRPPDPDCRLPAIFDCFIPNLLDAGYPHQPDQVIVNEYVMNQGIQPHIDRKDHFDHGVASLSMGGYATMVFHPPKHLSHLMPMGLLLEPRSLLILTGDARLDWYHSIPKVKVEVTANGKRFPRTKRVSITLRRVRDTAEVY